MINNNIYKSLLLMYESYNIVKDTKELPDDIKSLMIELITYFVDLNINVNKVIDDNETIILDEEMSKLIEEIKSKCNIDNIDKATLDKILLEYGKKINCNGNCGNNNDFITEATSKEVDKLIEELTLELGE